MNYSSLKLEEKNISYGYELEKYIFCKNHYFYKTKWNVLFCQNFHEPNRLSLM